MSEAKHSSLGIPWAEEPDEREGYEWNIHIVERDRSNMRVCFMSNGPDSEARAAFIVLATSLHHELVAALEAIAGCEDPRGDFAANFMMKTARAALQKAKQGDKQ